MAGDPYDILGVPRDAGDEEIRRAYRRLAKQEHPDAEGGDENYFCRLNDAYEAIRTPERRRAWSREGARGEGAWGKGPWGGGVRGGPGARAGAGARPRERASSLLGGDLFSLFDRIFGGGMPGDDTRGTDGHYRLEARLTPREARDGISMEIELPDGRHHIDVPPGVRDGDVLSFSESSPAVGRISVELEVVVG
ncbi:MAG: DnaJ domain-containing protein [Spirochaetaceae bacterium]